MTKCQKIRRYADQNPNKFDSLIPKVSNWRQAILPNEWTRRCRMRLRKGSIVIAVAISITLLLGVRLGPSALAMDCTTDAFQALNLTDEEFGKPVTNLTATLVPATPTVPEYCDVKGTMWPEINFEVSLPTKTWNNRLYMAGNGGKAGTIPSLVVPLQKGYAATGTDTGHKATLNPGSTFAYIDYPTPGANPNWYQKFLDFAYRSVHETIVVAKKIVKAYYNEVPAYTYWVGCSTGGRQGLMEAQRYPTDFNGILAGSPVNNNMITQEQGPEYMIPQACDGCQIPYAKLPILGAAVYAKCDSIDGLVDGIIDDPRKCNFDPDKDLVKCPNDVDGPACFTEAQLTAIKAIYAGAFSNGKLLIPGLSKGAEAFSGGWYNWFVSLPSQTPWYQHILYYTLVWDVFKYFAWDPQPNFNLLTDWNWDTDPPKTAARAKIVDAVDPHLWQFLAHGGKALMYAGWADCGPNPLANAVPYYENVLEVMGDRTRDVFAFYMVPGMGHCTGGVGCGNVDWFTPLVNWLENGIKPGSLIGSSTTSLARTRPICRYGEVARYVGTGSIDDANNFTCVEIIPAEVRFEPETIDLDSNGTFTAFIRFPERDHMRNWSQHRRDWEIISVVSEGASAVKVAEKGDTYIAKFNRQDLKNITPGEAVTFTVTVIVEPKWYHKDNWHHEHDTDQIAFEGSDTVRVVK
jgi:hypothetical protein